MSNQMCNESSDTNRQLHVKSNTNKRFKTIKEIILPSSLCSLEIGMHKRQIGNGLHVSGIRVITNTNTQTEARASMARTDRSMVLIRSEYNWTLE